METTLEELLVGDCEHILPLNHLTYSSNPILYKLKGNATIRTFLDDNRDVSEACVTRPLVEIGTGNEVVIKLIQQ